MNYQSDDSLTHYTPVFRAFEKAHPGITIETPNFPQGYREKLNTLLAAGTPPDLWLEDPFAGLDAATQGAILDLTPYLAEFPILKNTFPMRSSTGTRTNTLDRPTTSEIAPVVLQQELIRGGFPLPATQHKYSTFRSRKLVSVVSLAPF